jgi:Domain of unknown function (DUF1843)
LGEKDSEENVTDDALSEERAGRIFRDSRPYGDAISGALATGDLNEMRTAASFAESWLSDTEAELSRVRAALDRLRTAMSHLEPDASPDAPE